MKKYFLICIAFCAITSLASAGTRSDKALPAKTEEKRSKKKTVSSRITSRKKASSKKVVKKSTTKKSTTNSRTRKTILSRKGKKHTFKVPSKNAFISKTEPALQLTAEDIKMGDNFEDNRGKMSWPVDGWVSLPYGVYTIDGTTIKGDNPGIMFSTINKSEPVKAVFDGIVSDVNTKGEITSICIRHGKYSTVYGNLTAINVSKGDVVKKDQVIAEIGNGYNAEGGELTFLLMVNHDNVDPAPWLNH
jgi:septal ring factor EnvC (AmiA/AmiB activator)